MVAGSITRCHYLARYTGSTGRSRSGETMFQVSASPRPDSLQDAMFELATNYMFEYGEHCHVEEINILADINCTWTADNIQSVFF